MASLAPAPGAATATLHALPAAGRRKLRVGVYADRAAQPRWIVESLANVATSGIAEISAVYIENRGQTPVSRIQERSFRYAGKWGLTPVWRAYLAADRALFGSRMTAPSDLSRLVASHRRVGRDEFLNTAFDVVVALGDVDDAPLEPISRYGVWRHCFGDGHDVREALAGVREVIDAAPVTASAIRIRRGGADRIACASWARTLPYSVARSRDNVLAKTSQFLARALRDLRDEPDRWVERDTIPAAASAPPARPGAADALRLGRRVARRAAERILGIERWSLAYRFSAEESWDGSLAGFQRLEPPRDRFWADPFPFQRGERSYIFFEELPFAACKAHISVVEVDRAGNASAPRRVLERDYHLSYPFLVEEGGSLFMVPETAHNRSIEIYRCVEFPHRWRREKVLVDGVFCADATLHRASDGWWMFASSNADGAEVHDELHLYRAPSLLGEWKPYPRNPVKSDVRGARPAGALFRQGGELIRPAQICAPIYGAGIALNRVTRLGADGYAEEEVRRIVPRDASILGIHTINRAGDLSVLDLFARRPRFRGAA